MSARLLLETKDSRWVHFWLTHVEQLFSLLDEGAVLKTYGFQPKDLFDRMGLPYKEQITNHPDCPPVDFFVPTRELLLNPDEVLPIESLRLITRILQVKWVEEGQGVSYGHTWTAPRRTRIATIAIGYGDGYPRAFSNLGKMKVCGELASVVGRVCMDLTMLDITDLENTHSVMAGSEVTVLGNGAISWHAAAAVLGWSLEALLAGIRPRVKRTLSTESKELQIRL